MIHIRQQAEDYLAIRRSRGFRLGGYDRLLTDFAEYLEGQGLAAVTSKAALAWATQPRDVQPARWKCRLAVVRGFCGYLHTLDASVEVPATDLLVGRYHRPVPYLYSHAEIAALLAAADTLTPALRALTYRTFLGLLAATGMRLGEAIHLERADVDLQRGSILIRRAKFNKSRRLPLHPSTVAALNSYVQQRDRLCSKQRGASFFVSSLGTPLIGTCVRAVFAQLVCRVGLQPRLGSGRPRLHDLRHAFAVSTLEDWYRAGVDVASKVPLLSAYLGHVDPVSTYWYLEAAPALLALAADRLEHQRG